jgi:hypothetical protein
MKYNVSIEFDEIEAASPLDAALLIEDIITDLDVRVQYYVKDCDTKKIFSVDLAEEDDTLMVSSVEEADYKSVIQ